MMRKKIVAANWKMNGDLQQLTDLTKALLNGLDKGQQAHCILFSPSIYLFQMGHLIQGSMISLGAQNIYPADSGAYTGEISSPMIKEANCQYVLVGHSERRHIFKEDEKFVAEKFHHAKEHGIIPVLCVGESLEEREKEQTEEVISRQLLAVAETDKNSFSQCIIAYEPVWAIGTGKTATPEQAQSVHGFIRNVISELNKNDAEQMSILYGGSVNDKNAKAIFSMPDVDGGLVGGASLNAEQFLDIIKCIN